MRKALLIFGGIILAGLLVLVLFSEFAAACQKFPGGNVAKYQSQALRPRWSMCRES
jgi:hypothetical protein